MSFSSYSPLPRSSDTARGAARCRSHKPYVQDLSTPLRLVNELLAFAAALVALRLAGNLMGGWRRRRAPELAAWAAGLAAYAGACAALAWAAAAGWDDRVFRVYYLFGALLSVPLL